MTAIERLIGRGLEREHVDGVARFTPGQLAACLVPGLIDVGEVSFVDDFGEAWLIGASHEDDGWQPLYAYRGGNAHTVKPPETLNEAIVAALETAR